MEGNGVERLHVAFSSIREVVAKWAARSVRCIIPLHFLVFLNVNEQFYFPQHKWLSTPPTLLAPTTPELMAIWQHGLHRLFGIFSTSHDRFDLIVDTQKLVEFAWCQPPGILKILEESGYFLRQ